MKQDTPPLTVVLVHGAWADGSSWRKVIAALHQHGIAVTAAPIPLTSLTDDVTAVDRAVDRVGGPVVLVGHAYAGAVIGASSHSQVKALVYIAALAPDKDETVADVFYRASPDPAAPQLAPDPDGYIWLPTEAFAAAFAQHASTEDHTVLAAVQRPISVTCIQQPVPVPRWKELPAWLPGHNYLATLGPCQKSDGSGDAAGASNDENLAVLQRIGHVSTPSPWWRSLSWRCLPHNGRDNPKHTPQH